MTTHIRIVRVPPGEAPFWVRDQWVGLHLPLAQEAAAWWREKAPHLVQPNRYFVFPTDIAVVEQPSTQAANGP